MIEVGESSTQRWRVDSARWLSSSHRRLVSEPDRVVEGTTGQRAALLYGVAEVRMNYCVANLAIVGGDPREPQVLFRAPDFQCEASGVHWHAEDRFLTVHVPMSKKGFWRVRYVVAPCVFDLANRTFTFIPLSNSSYIQVARSNDGW